MPVAVILTGVYPFQAKKHSKTPAWPIETLPFAHPRLIPVVVGTVTGVLEVNVVVGLVGGGLEVVELVEVLVLVDALVEVGVGVLVVVEVLVDVNVLEVLGPHDIVKLTYWFWPLEDTVVLDGLIVQPGTVVAVSVTVASGQ